MSEQDTIVFHSAKGMNICDECETTLYVAKWGKGWLWFCPKCLKLWLD